MVQKQRFVLALFCFLFSHSVMSLEQRSDLAELVNDEFALTLDEMCEVYAHPTTMDSQQVFRIREFFKVDLEKAHRRLLYSPKQYNQIIASSAVQESTLTDKAKELLAWVNQLIAFEKIDIAREQIREIGVVSQNYHCQSRYTHFDQIIEDFKASNDPNKSAKIEHFNSLKQKLVQTECLKMTYAMADAGHRRVLVGDEMLSRTDFLTMKFVALHELCHIEFPGIRGMSNEEVFCDTMAWHWARQVMSVDELQELIGSESHPGLVFNILYPPNSHMDLLALRAQLPSLCRNQLLNTN